MYTIYYSPQLIARFQFCKLKTRNKNRNRNRNGNRPKGNSYKKMVHFLQTIHRSIHLSNDIEKAFDNLILSLAKRMWGCYHTKGTTVMDVL